MIPRRQVGLAHPLQQLPERRAPRHIRPQHQRVDEIPRQVFQRLIRPPGHRGAQHHIGPAARPRQHRRRGRLHHHEQSAPALPRQPRQRPVRLHRTPHRANSTPVRRHHRTRPVKRERHLRRQPRQPLPPEPQLPLLISSQQVPLPQREIRVLAPATAPRPAPPRIPAPYTPSPTTSRRGATAAEETPAVAPSPSSVDTRVDWLRFIYIRVDGQQSRRALSAVARSGPLEEPVPSTPRLRDKTDRYLLNREPIPDILPEEGIFCMLNRSQISVLDRDGSFDSFAEARPLGGWREARPALDGLPLWCRRSRCPDFGARSESRPVRSGQSDRGIHSNAMLASPGGDTKCARGFAGFEEHGLLRARMGAANGAGRSCRGAQRRRPRTGLQRVRRRVRHRPADPGRRG